jgi:hypothetical protein
MTNKDAFDLWWEWAVAPRSMRPRSGRNLGLNTPAQPDALRVGG